MPEQLATLCYVLTGGRLLLIRKKRGIGAGRINGPGGKVEPGETPLAAAIRETQEEVGVTPLDAELRGRLRFEFSDGLTLHCLIYLATRFEGVPQETAEAVPLWYQVDALPYEEMWPDDRHWLPLLLRGDRFAGTVVIVDGAVTRQTVSYLINEEFISCMRVSNMQ